MQISGRAPSPHPPRFSLSTGKTDDNRSCTRVPTITEHAYFISNSGYGKERRILVGPYRDKKIARREPGRGEKILSDHRQDGNGAHRL